MRLPARLAPPMRTSALAAARIALARHWSAVVALTLFLLAGLAILDDYGVATDESVQRSIAIANLEYFTGDASALPSANNSFYGAAFEAPLLLAERIFGIEDSRGVALARHLLTHLFFLAGGVFAYFLTCRLFGNRLLALFAMLVFLLHPRLYAHSYFNSKDVPFFTMFVVALYLTHRAFRGGSISSFALLGAGVGVLANLRIMGLFLFPAILIMQTLDTALASGRPERKRILVAAGVFLLAGGLTTYALLPYLWSDPLGSSIAWWTASSDHPRIPFELFRGDFYRSVDFPADYLPVWIAITTPPFALLLGVAGAVGVLAGAIKAPLAGIRNTRTRFGALLVGCLAAPALAVILLDLNIYNGWRQMYFLWAPLALLAVFGLRRLAPPLRKPHLKAAAYGAAGAGVAATLVSMALLHPNQQISFNFLVDRTTPEHLRTQYMMDYWSLSTLQGLKRLVAERPLTPANAHSLSEQRDGVVKRNMAMLPRNERDKIALSVGIDALVVADDSALFYAINPDRNRAHTERLSHSVTVYNNAVTRIERKADLRTIYQRAAAQEPRIESGFDVYLIDNALAYVKEPCLETDPALSHKSDFYVRFIPRERDDLTEGDDRRKGFKEVRFRFPGYGAFFDAKCVASVPFPPYPIAAVRTRETLDGGILWIGGFRIETAAHRDLYERIRSEEPLVRSVFDIYAVDGELVYAKDQCDATETAHPFFLHVIPEHVNDLPEERRRFGFANLDFEMLLIHGAVFDGECIASVPLPEYPIVGARTGQRARSVWDPNSGELLREEQEIWRVEFSLGSMDVDAEDGARRNRAGLG